MSLANRRITDSNKKLKRWRLTLLVTLIFFTCISAVSFSYKYYSLEEASSKMERIERTLQNLRAAMNVDSVRQYNIQKIMKIIEQYNSSLSSSKKYEIADEIYRMSVKYTNLDVDLICATITHETALTWRLDIVSQAGAMGLMQIMPGTGVFLAQYEGITWTTPEAVLFDPIYNIRLGCRYLSTLIDLYQLDGGLAAYNGGEKRAALWIAKNREEGILVAETRGYIPAIMALYEKFRNEGGVL